MIEYTVQVDDNSTSWYLDGVRHRVDGPAVEYANGTKWWLQNGQRHRADGPALEYTDGTKFWYLNGVEVTEEEVMKPVKQLTVAQIEVLLGHKIKVIAG